jgi:hypothetical protein
MKLYILGFKVCFSKWGFLCRYAAAKKTGRNVGQVLVRWALQRWGAARWNQVDP